MQPSQALQEDPDSSEQQDNNIKQGLISKIGKKLISIFQPKQKASFKESIEEFLEEEYEEEGGLEEDQKAILRNILEFNELTVEDIMIPRADIFALSNNIAFEDLQDKLLKKTYTRIPIYKEDLDEILGFVHIKDIARKFFENKELNISNILRKCLFVPASMRINNLLVRMQQSHVHIAIVVDEYGGTEGIITLEDILEEIVGKIDDEHVTDDNLIFNVISENEYELSSRVLVEDVIEKTGMLIENNDDEYSTIGGLIYNKIGRIPVKGEVIDLNEAIEVEILDAEIRRIKKVKIRNKT